MLRREVDELWLVMVKPGDRTGDDMNYSAKVSLFVARVNSGIRSTALDHSGTVRAE